MLRSMFCLPQNNSRRSKLAEDLEANFITAEVDPVLQARTSQVAPAAACAHQKVGVKT